MPSSNPRAARRYWRTGALAAGLLCSLTVTGQERWAPDKPEPGSVEAIAQFTTEPRFGNPWVAYVPDSATVPSPSRFLGHIADAKGEDALEGRPAILDVPVAKGRVIAYNFNPMHRDLNRSDCRLLWNAILNWQAIAREKR